MPSLMSTHDMIQEILGNIFKAEYRRLGTWIDRICRENRDAYSDQTLQGFVYQGKVYKETAQTLADHMLNRRGLHASLSSTMDAYLVDLGTLSRDKAFISQALVMVLEPCQDRQDVRDALPDCLTDTLGYINGMSRGVRPMAFTIAENERALRQFNKILPRVEMYAATRLIY